MFSNHKYGNTDIEDNIQKMKSILLICDEVEGVTN